MRRAESVTTLEEATSASTHYRRKWLTRHIATPGCAKATIVERGCPGSVKPEPGEILHILGPKGDNSPSAEIREGAGVRFDLGTGTGGAEVSEKSREAGAIFEKFTGVKYSALVAAMKENVVYKDGRVMEDATYEVAASILQLPHGTTMLNRAAFREAFKEARL